MEEESAISSHRPILFLQRRLNPPRSASMVYSMENQTHARFLAANQELRDFLRRVVCLANGVGKVTDEDLERISLRLMNLAPEVGDASRSETLDTSLLSEVAEYVKNLSALQGALEKVRAVIPARRARPESKKRRTDGLQGWFDPRQQIT